MSVNCGVCSPDIELQHHHGEYNLDQYEVDCRNYQNLFRIYFGYLEYGMSPPEGITQLCYEVIVAPKLLL